CSFRHFAASFSRKTRPRSTALRACGAVAVASGGTGFFGSSDRTGLAQTTRRPSIVPATQRVQRECLTGTPFREGFPPDSPGAVGLSSGSPAPRSTRKRRAEDRSGAWGVSFGRDALLGFDLERRPLPAVNVRDPVFRGQLPHGQYAT